MIKLKKKKKKKKRNKRSKEIKQTQGVRLQSGRCSTIPTRLPKQVQVQEHTHTKHPDIFTKCNVCKASKSVAHSLHCTSRHEVVEKHKYVSMCLCLCVMRGSCISGPMQEAKTVCTGSDSITAYPQEHTMVASRRPC